MKLETVNSSVDVKTNLQMTSIKAELSQDKLHKMWDLLQSPYRDPISSLIREYVSNAFDSHIEAGVDYPVYVTLEQDQSGWFWACEDFGVGLSPERCQDVFMKYLNSTKEDTNDQIGAFGMGSKSGLGYTDVVHIRTRFDGIEYNYMLHKTSDAPTLSLLNSSSTDKRNGTLIKVYLKDTWREETNFKEKTKTQLAYFDNVTYGGSLKGLDEDLIVYKAKHFSYNASEPYDEFHILIGKVIYPINWEALGLSRVRMPIALNFNIGDLPVIFTREDIRYTDNGLKKLREKIELVLEELIELASPKEGLTDNLEKYYSLIYGDPFIQFGESSVELTQEVTKLIDTSKVVYTPNPYLKFKKKGNYLSALTNLFCYTLTCHRQIKRGKSYSINSDAYTHGKYQRTVLDNPYVSDKCILMDEESDPRKNRYISSTVGTYFYLLKDNRKKLKLKDYITILRLDESPKSTWRDQIKWYQKMQDELFDQFFKYKYSDIEVPDSFEKSASLSPTRTIVGTDEIRFKLFRETETEKWNNRNDVHVTGELHVSTLDDLKTKKVIWSTRDQDEALKYTFRFIENFRRYCNIPAYTVISVANKDVEIMETLEEENSNIVSLDNWYLSENELFDSFVFFNKFSSLVEYYNAKGVYRQPNNFPYYKYRSAVQSYKYRLSEEFIDYLLNLYVIQGKQLKLKGLNALRSWAKAEKNLDFKMKFIAKSQISNFKSNELAKVLLAIQLEPNRPLNKAFAEIKQNYLLINKQ
jgi:hypothetical protein